MRWKSEMKSQMVRALDVLDLVVGGEVDLELES